MNVDMTQLRMLVLDVDGVLSDGKLYLGNEGEELKTFNIQDGLGLKLLQRNGIVVAIITGRNSDIVNRRCAELGIEHVVQGRSDKLVALGELAAALGMNLGNIAYMGDDLPDLAAIRACGCGMTVLDAREEVRREADWISSKCGGYGAVRDACEAILKAQRKWDSILQEYM